MTVTRRQFLAGALATPVAAKLVPLLPEAPVNIITQEVTQGFNPVIIGIVRRAHVELMVSQLLGVQPMTGPTGEIFKLGGLQCDLKT